MTQLLQDLTNLNEELYLSMGQVQEMEKSLKQIDFTAIDFLSKVGGNYGVVKSIPIYSQEYRSSLKKEIAILEEKKKLMEAMKKEIKKQINN